jgi:DNA topoisomerase-1
LKLRLNDDISIPTGEIEKIIAGPEASAKAVSLVYVNDRQEGILRAGKGKNFRYYYRNKILRDKSQLDRIKSLVLPPAWQNVWICVLENGHLQATGFDLLKRKQYRYHPLWNDLRNQTKFYRLLEFAKALPEIRKQVKKDMARPGLPAEKVLATVIALMENTCIRIGNEAYEKMYGSVGLTTMKDKHVKLKSGELQFCFTGKKGKEHNVTLKSKKLATIVRHCRDIPGRELFQYYDEDGTKRSIDSGMVNDYIRSITGSDFTAKDFRTWAGTVHSLVALREAGEFESEAEAKRKVVETLDKVAAQLGNTRAVCRKYYVHPHLIELYEKKKWTNLLGKKLPSVKKSAFLKPEERLLIQLLKKAS